MSDKRKTWYADWVVIWAVFVLLLIAGGVVCVWTFSALRQRKSIDAIKSAAIDGRADVNYDYEIDEDFELTMLGRPGPVWLADQLGVDFYATARQATLFNANDDQIQLLTKLTGLRSISLNGKALTDAGMSLLRHLPELESVLLDCRSAPRLVPARKQLVSSHRRSHLQQHSLRWAAGVCHPAALNPGVAPDVWKLCGEILDQFTESECRNYFHHSGYRYT